MNCVRGVKESFYYKKSTFAETKKRRKMKITRANTSKLSSVDFSNLEFGKIFTDHMLICKFSNGSWGEAEILPYQKLDFSLGLHALHYGQAAFEGQKAYRQEDGSVAIFRPEKNWERLNRSAERLMMPSVPKEVFIDGLKKLVEIDQEWVPQDPEKSLYLRPFMFSSSEFIAARPSEEFIFAVLMSPVGAYYPKPVKVKVEEKYSRSAPGGIGFTKAAGNYGGAFYPTNEAIKQGFNQIVWTDPVEHKFIEESGTMNIMFKVGDTMITPPLSDRILAGITRESIITLLKSWGMNVEERRVSIDEIYQAYKEGNLHEAFGMGTAAVVSKISHIGYKGEMMELEIKDNSIADKIKKALTDIRLGKVEDTFGWMVKL